MSLILDLDKIADMQEMLAAQHTIALARVSNKKNQIFNLACMIGKNELKKNELKDELEILSRQAKDLEQYEFQAGTIKHAKELLEILLNNADYKKAGEGV
jgi:hypothetical protein